MLGFEKIAFSFGSQPPSSVSIRTHTHTCVCVCLSVSMCVWGI